MSCCSEKKQPTKRDSQKCKKYAGRSKNQILFRYYLEYQMQNQKEKMQIWRLLDATENTDILSRIQAFQQYLDVDMNILHEPLNPRMKRIMIANLKILEERYDTFIMNFEKQRGSLAKKCKQVVHLLHHLNLLRRRRNPFRRRLLSVPHEKQTTPTETFLAELPEEFKAICKLFDSKEGKLFKELFSEGSLLLEKSKICKEIFRSYFGAFHQLQKLVFRKLFGENFGGDEGETWRITSKLLARLFSLILWKNPTAQDVLTKESYRGRYDQFNQNIFDGMELLTLMRKF